MPVPGSRGNKMRSATWEVTELTPVEHPSRPLNAREDGSYYHSVESPKRGVAYGIAWS